MSVSNKNNSLTQSAAPPYATTFVFLDICSFVNKRLFDSPAIITLLLCILFKHEYKAKTWYKNKAVGN